MYSDSTEVLHVQVVHTKVEHVITHTGTTKTVLGCSNRVISPRHTALMFQWLYLQITFHIEVGGGAIKEIPGQQSLDCNGLYCVT